VPGLWNADGRARSGHRGVVAELVARAAAGRRVHACRSYDRAGLAWSDAAGQPLGAGRLADQLHALLAAAAVPPPYVLVGHSFGGPSWSSTRSARSSTALEDSTRSSPE
jgi:pimeloyl-ACP methyl ester carboxylesterase